MDVDHGFVLTKKFKHGDSFTVFRSISLFPWNHESLATLWQGSLNTTEFQDGWKSTVSQWADAVAVGSNSKLYILFLKGQRPPICVKIPPTKSPSSLTTNDGVKVAWSLRPESPFEPLVLFSFLSLLYVWNAKTCQMLSYLRGHGQSITSIAVHPVMPQLFCTTSRDFTARVYDLRLTPQQFPNNDLWPPSRQPSLAGAAHGLHMNETEGSGIGRCVVVLMGGRSGGHQAALLGAAFHPILPVIATCGVDRQVKIWYLNPTSSESITREDKPLFSSSRVHKARVLSVTWLDHDLLLTHGAPALYREKLSDGTLDEEISIEEGTLVIWRWLAIDRFFPPNHPVEQRQKVLRGCASDYQESSSFKLISIHSLPLAEVEVSPTPSDKGKGKAPPEADISVTDPEDVTIKHPTVVRQQFITPNLHAIRSKRAPYAVFTFPKSRSVRLFKLTDMQPRKAPPFPWDESAGTRRGPADDWSRTAEGEKPPDVPGWDIKTDGGEETLENCAIAMDGRVIIGVGCYGTLWVWEYQPHR